MQPKIYHGTLKPQDIAQALMGQFNRGNYRVQQIGSGDKITIQISTREQLSSGGQTALAVWIEKVSDGVSVRIGQQAWFGVAASLGMSALAALRNPFSLLGRLDDIAQDIESIQLTEQVWKVIEAAAHSAGASFELSERLRRTTCNYCNTPNPIGEANCIACGAPLGDVQPRTCKQCGFVIKKEDQFCPNCRYPIN